MSKQPRSARDYRERLRNMGIMIPTEAGDPRQLWILVRQDPVDNEPGCFFVSHGRNYDKFASRKGFEILGHAFDRQALTAAARRATKVCGAQYQPKFSVKPGSDVKPGLDSEAEGDAWDDYASEAPLHDLDSFIDESSKPS